MRVKATITEQDLSLPLAQQGYERYVPLGHYVPIETKLTSFYHKSRTKKGRDYIAGLIDAFTGNFSDPLGSNIGLRKAIERGPARMRPVASGRRSGFFSFAPQPVAREADPYPSTAAAAAKDLQNAIAAAQTMGEQMQVWSAFEDNPALSPVQTAIDRFWNQYGLTNLTSRVGKAIRDVVLPVGRPDFTSELGLMYLDRTAVKRGKFEIGERLYVLTLGPGEETTLEKRIVQKSSLSFEEAFERDVESKLEADSETTDTTNTSQSLTTSEKTSRNTTVGADLNLQVPGGSIPVNGKIGVQQSDQFDSATDEANQQSRNIAVRATQRISSSLRTQHKTTFRETQESTLESLTRRVIRNPNPETAIDLVYFKVMEKLTLQQERTGIRLCWAPFIADPASRVRQRMKVAYQKVIDERLSRLSLPQPPMPPEPQTTPVWVSSIRWPLMLGIFNSCAETREFYVPIRKSDFFTGNLRASIEWNGDTPRGTAWVVQSSSSLGVVDDREGFEAMFPDLELDDYSGYVKIVAEVTIPQALISGKFPDLVAEAEVLRALPVYEETLSTYLHVKQQYDHTVSVMKNEAIAEAEPAALEAMAEVLRATDVRAELMHAVVTQYIAPAHRDTGKDIELWQRLIDFNNIGFELYPAWWETDDPPVPQLPSNHFINASWARVFLPVATDASRPAAMEKMFLNRLFAAHELNDSDVQLFNKFVTSLTTGLVEAQKQFMSADRWKKETWINVGEPWTVLVPTDGTHCEVIQSASHAFSELGERKAIAGVKLIEEQGAAIAAENVLRGNVDTPIPGQVIVGQMTDY